MMNLIELFFGTEKAVAEQQPPAILPGRNEPCWCGSGVKYKQCHQLRDEQRRELERERNRACTSFT
jgi:hypothetical protein